MQTNCGRCSRPIALTDVIEASDGQLSHADCEQPQGLTAEERTLLFVFCSDHAVAYCVSCGLSFRLMELGADSVAARTNLCPRCRRDLTETARAHIFRCVTLPSELRQRTQEVREAAQHLIKRSQALSDKADVVIREAEAHLFERQQGLRAAMAKTKS